jgi:hypothetical protein
MLTPDTAIYNSNLEQSVQPLWFLQAKKDEEFAKKNGRLPKDYSHELSDTFKKNGDPFVTVDILNGQHFTLKPRELWKKLESTRIGGIPILKALANIVAMRNAAESSREFPAGYNNHGIEHIDFFKNHTPEIINILAKSPGETYTNEEIDFANTFAIYLGQFHDVGMIHDLRTHAERSPDLLRKLIPGIDTADPVLWNFLKLGIEIHDSSSMSLNGLDAKKLFMYWKTGKTEGTPIAAENLAILNALNNHPKARAVKLAYVAFFLTDKIHFGEDRLSSGAKPDEILKDVHAQINANSSAPLITHMDNKLIIKLTHKPYKGAEMAFHEWKTQMEIINANRLLAAQAAVEVIYPYLVIKIDYEEQGSNRIYRYPAALTKLPPLY